MVVFHNNKESTEIAYRAQRTTITYLRALSVSLVPFAVKKYREFDLLC